MSAKAVLDRARSQIGVKEKPKGSNRVKYTKEYGLVGPWCVMFLWWCFRHEGYGADVFPTTASTGAKWAGLMQWAKKEGRWKTGRPKVGDIVVFSYSHVGIVEKVHGRRNVTTIEGNTDTSGSRTGGMVMRKRRTSSILGYFRPNYKAGGTAEAPKKEGIASMAHRYYGVKKQDVKAGERATLTLEKGKKTGYALGAGMEFVATVSVRLDGFKGRGQLRFYLYDPKTQKVGWYDPIEFEATPGMTVVHAVQTGNASNGRHLRVAIGGGSEALKIDGGRVDMLFS